MLLRKLHACHPQEPERLALAQFSTPRSHKANKIRAWTVRPFQASTQEQIGAMLEERRKAVSDSIRVIPHFPKEGIMFQDITTLLLDPIAFQYSIEDFVQRFRDQQVDVVAGSVQHSVLLVQLAAESTCPTIGC